MSDTDIDKELEEIEARERKKLKKAFKALPWYLKIDEVMSNLVLLVCFLPGGPLPVIILNTFSERLPDKWCSYEPWLNVAMIIAILQYILLGSFFYFLSPLVAAIFACCVMPFYLYLVTKAVLPKRWNKHLYERRMKAFTDD